MNRIISLSMGLCALIVVAPGLRAADVFVTTEVSGSSSILLGQTTTVNVFGSVQNALTSTDGIFTFDLDLVIANILQNEPSVLEVMSVSRPNIDPDPLFGGDGTVGPDGVKAVHGTFLVDNAGLGAAPTLLASVVVKGVAVGAGSVVPGPSVDPYQFDFLLYESSPTATSVTYDDGVRIDVAVVPEPAGLSLLFLGAPLLRRFRRR